MLPHLPIELVYMIAEASSPKTLATLALTCRQLYSICNRILYRYDFEINGSYSVFHAIVFCHHHQNDALKTLEAARLGGADFKRCRGIFHRNHLVMQDAHIVYYSPIHLAARRGLDLIVSFLLTCGISPDGPENLDRTPLFEAIHNRRDSTAVLLAQNGASLDLYAPNISLLRASIQECLPRLTTYLVQACRVDINGTLEFGFTPLTLAIQYRRTCMISIVIDLGANIFDLLWNYCQNGSFTLMRWIIESASTSLARALRTEQCLDLILLVSHKLSSAYKELKMSLIDLLLRLLKVTGAENNYHTATQSQSQQLIDGLLGRALSIDCADIDTASLLTMHGATIQAGTLTEILSVLISTPFAQNLEQVLRHHPTILQSFSFALSYCKSLSPTGRGFMVDYFLSRVPGHALTLVWDLSQANLPLTKRGVQELRAIKAGTS